MMFIFGKYFAFYKYAKLKKEKRKEKERKKKSRKKLWAGPTHCPVVRRLFPC
jgi:hypothetical protein